MGKKKKIKKKDVIVVDWLNRLEIYVISRKKQFDEFIVDYHLQEADVADDWECANGSVCVLYRDSLPYFCFIFPTRTERVIVHESVHMAQAIMEEKGIPVNNDTTEVLAYMSDFFYSKLKGML